MAEQFNAYRRVDIETASQEKLIIMLFNGAIQRARDARALLDAEKLDIPAIHKKLVRTQEILVELRAALDVNANDAARNLDRLYEFLIHQLVQANIKKDTATLDASIDLLVQLRDMWEEAIAANGHDVSAERPAPSNPHGASKMNLQG